MSVRFAGSIAGIALGLVLGLAQPSGALETLRIRLAGGDDDLVRAVENGSLLAAAYRDGVEDPVEVLAAARADYARLVAALYSQGFYGGVVNISVDGREAAEINPLANPGRVSRVEVRIVPGPRYRFSQAEIGPLASGTRIPEDFAPGRPARVEIIREAADVAVLGWREVGHAKAGIGGQEITADHATDRVSARIGVAPGPQLRFGELIVTGQSRMSERRVRKVAELPTGEVYSPAKLNRSATRLRRTGVFRSVTLTEAEEPNADGTLDVTAQVVDQKPRRFGFGAEYSTVEGIGLSGFWMHRNLIGGGERLRVGGEITGIAGDTGGIDYALNVDLTRPATLSADTDATVSFALEKRDEPDFTSETARLGLHFLHRLRDNLTLTAGVEYAASEVEDALGTTSYDHVFFPLGAVYDKRENLLDTKDGYYAALDVAPFLGVSGSESGVLSELDLRAYEDYGDDSAFVLAARVQMGSISGASITGLPNDLRFYSGGGGTVRGQDYQSLEVDLGGGVLSGGRSFLGVQAELRGRVTEDISVVGFYDWGHVSAASLPGSGGESHSGAGIGARYMTPIGPLRLDVAVPVSGPGDNTGYHLYIGVGQAF